MCEHFSHVHTGGIGWLQMSVYYILHYGTSSGISMSDVEHVENKKGVIFNHTFFVGYFVYSLRLPVIASNTEAGAGPNAQHVNVGIPLNVVLPSSTMREHGVWLSIPS